MEAMWLLAGSFDVWNAHDVAIKIDDKYTTFGRPETPCTHYNDVNGRMHPAATRHKAYQLIRNYIIRFVLENITVAQIISIFTQQTCCRAIRSPVPWHKPPI